MWRGAWIGVGKAFGEYCPVGAGSSVSWAVIDALLGSGTDVDGKASLSA